MKEILRSVDRRISCKKRMNATVLLLMMIMIFAIIGRTTIHGRQQKQGTPIVRKILLFTSSVLPTILVAEALPELKRTLPAATTRIKNNHQQHQKMRQPTNDQKKHRQVETHQSKKRKKKEKKEDTADNDDAMNNSHFRDNLAIESFLLPRIIPARKILDILFLFVVLWSFIKCVQTSGIPFAQTIHRLLEGGGEERDSSNNRFQLYNRRPSPLDVRLARLLLSCDDATTDMIPPEFLPSAKPLLGFIVSVAIYVGVTFLFPRWSTKFRVFMDFRKLDTIVPSSLSSSSNSNNNASVLVRRRPLSVTSGVGESKEHTSASSIINDKKDFLIIPLERSAVGRSTAKKVTTGKKINDDNYVHPSDWYFDLNHQRIYCDPDTKVCIEGAPNLQTAEISTLCQLVETGGLTKKQHRIGTERYAPYNTFTLTSPTFMEAFLGRILSPLVVIQLVGKVISLLEEGPGALIMVFITLAQHYMNARQAIVSATQLAQEVKTNLQDTSDYRVSIWSKAKDRWIAAVAKELIPGDIFRLKMQGDNVVDTFSEDESGTTLKNQLIVPVDALVLKGQCLVNEAILTGESVPQIKVPIDFDEEKIETKDYNSTIVHKDGAPPRRLDVHKDRLSILFAGTTLFHSLEHSEVTEKNSTADSGDCGSVTCIALSTGTYSSKGRLLQALKGGGHVGAISNRNSERDTMYLISSLSFCAFCSCLSLFIRRDGKSRIKVTPYRRAIQCTRILLSSIPSDLPLALASIAKSCSKKLRYQADVVCSEPGSLLTAAYIDTVVFDKTGTLTADTQSLAKVVSAPSLSKPHISDEFQRFALAGCHSLIQYQKQAFGDPLDKAAIKFSRWIYDQSSDSYFRPKPDSKFPHTEPVRLWQIRQFPFDPSLRLSSAIVLLQLEDFSLELWKLTKGSPDSMINLLKKDQNIFDSEFNHRCQKIEMQGYRSVALGACNLTNSNIAQAIFPDGLSTDSQTLIKARMKGERIRRNEIEVHASDGEELGLTFCGFCCFDASIRPSSKRIINELSRGGIKCIMLTGDSVDAALNVARKVNIFKDQKIAMIDSLDSDVHGKDSLVWIIMHLKVRKDGSFRIHRRSRKEVVTIASVKKFTKLYEKGQYTIAANGRALESILFGKSDQLGKLVSCNLAAVSVIARATPELKKEVIDVLKHRCHKRVMMCGDGVNDVAAIQSADTAASLLTGFGDENNEAGIDIDDRRRKKKVNSMNIGGNRVKNNGRVGRTNKNQQAQERLRKQIEKYRDEINTRSANSESRGKEHTFKDLKDMISATMRAARDERHRAEQLQKGGGDAARILAEDSRQEILSENDDSENLGSFDANIIKPGEASLVSSFSCLHPSVDGVDAILREGIATAASVFATTQSFGLHSLMTCFYLATLYRDGFRYGKYMWNAELMLYQMLESARYNTSCTPRPRLPNTVIERPPTSLFQLSSIIAIVLEAIIHISCMTIGVQYAKRLDDDIKPAANEGKSKIRLDHMFLSREKKLGKLVGCLLQQSLSSTTQNEGDTSNSNIFSRARPFSPNYQTNSVFIFSVLQSALSALLNHKGSPFYHGILENRDLCRWFCMTFLFVTICITGSMPLITNFLEVRSLPSKRSKLVFLGLSGINIIACVLCRVGCDRLLFTVRFPASNNKIKFKNNAADHEEKLLLEEAALNRKGIVMFCGLVVYFIFDAFKS